MDPNITAATIEVTGPLQGISPLVSTDMQRQLGQTPEEICSRPFVLETQESCEVQSIHIDISRNTPVTKDTSELFIISSLSMGELSLFLLLYYRWKLLTYIKFQGGQACNAGVE